MSFCAFLIIVRKGITQKHKNEKRVEFNVQIPYMYIN